MRQKFAAITLWTLVAVLMVGSLAVAQQNRRAPWGERSPGIGKIVPDMKIFNEKLQQIQFSSLYKGHYLYLQWGGCT